MNKTGKKIVYVIEYEVEPSLVDMQRIEDELNSLGEMRIIDVKVKESKDKKSKDKK